LTEDSRRQLTQLTLRRARRVHSARWYLAGTILASLGLQLLVSLPGNLWVVIRGAFAPNDFFRLALLLGLALLAGGIACGVRALFLLRRSPGR
jgi:hypothetical protein